MPQKPKKPIPAEAGQMPPEVATAMSAVVDAIHTHGKSVDRQIQSNLTRAREHLAQALAAQVVDPALAVDHARKASRFAALATGQPVPPLVETSPPPPEDHPDHGSLEGKLERLLTAGECQDRGVPDRLGDLELTPLVVTRYPDTERVAGPASVAASTVPRAPSTNTVDTLAGAIATGVTEGLRRAVPLLPAWARAELALFADPTAKGPSLPPPPEPKSRAPRPRGETRDRVIELLRAGPQRAAPLATACGVSQGALIPTLRKMAARGQIESCREGKARFFRLPS